MENIQDILKYLRGKKGLNQSYIADLLGISIASYSDLERGKTKPSIEHIKVLSEFYGISTDIILGMHKANAHLIELTPFSNFIEKSAPKSASNSASNQQNIVLEPSTEYAANITQEQNTQDLIITQKKLIAHLEQENASLRSQIAKNTQDRSKNQK